VVFARVVCSRVVCSRVVCSRVVFALATVACARDTRPPPTAAAAGPADVRDAAWPDAPSDRAWALLARGGDTLAVERLATGTAWAHAERTLTRLGTRQRFTRLAAADGEHWELAREGPEPAHVMRQRFLPRAHGLVVLHGAPLGAVVTVDTVPAPADVAPWLDGSALSLEALARRAVGARPPRAVATSRPTRVVAIARPSAVVPVAVRRGGADTVHVAHPDGAWWVRLDADGRLLEAGAPSRGLRLVPMPYAPMSPVPLPAEPSPRGARRPARAYDVVLRAADGVRLAGTLTLPAADSAGARVPAVLLLSGDGPQTRDLAVAGLVGYAPFAELASALAQAGIASLRLDDRGAGASGGAAFSHGAAAELADARTALAWLRARPEIAPGAVALVGHSDGGLRALHVAAAEHAQHPGPARRGQGPRAVVTLGTPARAGAALGCAQRAQWIASRAPAAHGAPACDEPRHAALAAVDPWLRDWLAREPRVDLAAVPVPVLVVHGDADAQVPAAEAAALASLVRAQAATRVDVRLLPGVDHWLRHAGAAATREAAAAAVSAGVGGRPDGVSRDGARPPAPALDASVRDAVVDWLRAALPRAAAGFP
jgi:alpha/beta superfamily hydrolase